MGIESLVGLALALGVRHACDPDHLVAVSSLVAADGGRARGAARLGAFWGLGHSVTLLAIGLPLIALKGSLPIWLEAGAERVVGLLIVALALGVVWKWWRGDFRAGIHTHSRERTDTTTARHSHLRRSGPTVGEHRHRYVRSPARAFAVGALHGFAGTGAVVIVLVAALPSQLAASVALVGLAPVSVLSMATITSTWAWLLTRPLVEPLYRGVLVPIIGAFGVFFGAWYVGI